MCDANSQAVPSGRDSEAATYGSHTYLHRTGHSKASMVVILHTSSGHRGAWLMSPSRPSCLAVVCN